MSYTIQKYVALIRPNTASDSIYHNPTDAEIYLGVYEGADALEKAAADAWTAPENIRLISFQNLDKELMHHSHSGAKTILSLESTDGNSMTLSIEDLAAQLGMPSIDQVTLTVKDNDGVSISAVVNTLDTDYPAINIEGADSNNNNLYFANVELPNSEYPDTITARLMAGYELYETDTPIAMVPTRLISPKELEQRVNAHPAASTVPQKIIYVDRNLALTQPWINIAIDEPLKEHEPEYKTGGV